MCGELQRSHFVQFIWTGPDKAQDDLMPSGDNGNALGASALQVKNFGVETSIADRHVTSVITQ